MKSVIYKALHYAVLPSLPLHSFL